MSTFQFIVMLLMFAQLYSYQVAFFHKELDRTARFAVVVLVILANLLVALGVQFAFNIALAQFIAS